MRRVARSTSLASHLWAWPAIVIAGALFLGACTSSDDDEAGEQPDLASIEATQIGVGTLFTANEDCADTTMALFDRPENVHITGGPTLSGPRGLPDGTYYVQVTAPDGTMLGTSGSDSPVTVTDGRFERCLRLVDVVDQASTGTSGFDSTTDTEGRYQVGISVDPEFATTLVFTSVFNLRSSGAADASVEVIKFYDSNTNGVPDSGEVVINGWLVRVVDDIYGYVAEAFTPWSSAVVPGNYSVSELIPDQANWRTTTPSPIGVTLIEGQDTTVAIGNVCLGPGGAESIEFWTSREGAALITPTQLRQLSEQNLVTAQGETFDPTTYPQLRQWLQEQSSANMANALSVSLAVMTLNVSTGKVDRTALIHAPEARGANPVGFISVADLQQEADAAIAAAGNTPIGSTQRAYQESLRNPLQRANDDLDFVQAQPCSVTFGEIHGNGR